MSLDWERVRAMTARARDWNAGRAKPKPKLRPREKV